MSKIVCYKFDDVYLILGVFIEEEENKYLYLLFYFYMCIVVYINYSIYVCIYIN